VEQQILHWTPLVLAVSLALFVMVWSRPARKERRSFGQRIIFVLYKTARWVWAIARAVDTGYLEYCRVVADKSLEIENEKVFGNRIKPAGKESSPEALKWKTAQKSA
jgi:hypothetical protein